MKIALDRRLLRSALNVDAPQHDVLVQIIRHAEVCVLRLVAEEIEADGDEAERRSWRAAGLCAVEADDFMKGYATRIAKRYVDYYPDPRDCRLVAEAQCAKINLLVTASEGLIRGLSNRAENVRLVRPSEALRCLTSTNPSPPEAA